MIGTSRRGRINFSQEKCDMDTSSIDLTFVPELLRLPDSQVRL